MTRIYHNKKDYNGIVIVNGKTVSISDHKLGGFNHLTLQEEKKLNEYIKHYNL